MPSWLASAAGKHPDRIAIETPEGSLAYSELSKAAVEWAGRLLGAGAEPGSRVPLALADPVQFVVALHGCLLAGLAAVPIDLRLTAEEQARRERGPAPGPGVAAVMHTSGTTAEPKPVPLTCDNFQASALGSAVALGLDRDERWLCPMPLTHVGGLSIPIRSAIYATTAVVHGRFQTEAVLEELMNPERRITLVSLVPTMLARLLDAGLAGPPALRWALLGGGPIPPALLERAAAARVPVAPTYGMTEACSQIATFGWPLSGVEIRTSQGEVLVRGPIVAAGAADSEGWLHTGDLGEIDERGRLSITGRRGDTIITGGENVAPTEVEAVLLDHPDVSDAAVIGRSDAEWGEALVALVVARDGRAPDVESLRLHCRARLAGFKVPKTVEFVPVLPRSASGKLLRRELG